MHNSTPRKNKASSLYHVILAALVVLFLLAAAPAIAEDQGSVETLRQMGKAFAGIAEKASPAVVGIEVKSTVTQTLPSMPDWPFGEPFDPFGDDFFERFFRRGFPRRRSPQRKFHHTAQGSGFIISSDGYILTNNHLVGDADDDSINVKLAGDRELKAKLIGTDPESDIAVIKIQEDGLPTLELADSDRIEVGEWVIAIGNPFGLSHTVTAGIVSAKGRSGVGITTYEDFIQTDAAINPGNSGGPLLNLNGKVVGINTAIISRTRGNIGIGFAIPINMAKAIYDQLVDTGTVARGFLGVIIQDLTSELAASFSLEDAKGVLIPEVTEDSAAEKAGLKPGDIIIELDGKPVEKAKSLQNRVAMSKPGTKVTLTILRDGKTKKIPVELGERPSPKQLAAGQSEALEKLGLSVQNLTDELAERLGYKGQTGVIVSKVEPGSLAKMAGIRNGTLIIEVNRKPVKNTKDFKKQIEKATKEGTVLLLIKDQNFTRFVVLTIPEE